MPKIERSGIYRDENGCARWLRKNTHVNAETFSRFALEEEAALSPSREAIIVAELSQYGRHRAPIEGVDVVSAETDNVTYPAAIETPEDSAPPVETPEDDKPDDEKRDAE